ncbi:hypothetical protein HZH66_005874 [Vespula vulgaris]|uniref:Uncharacterized protein n=1 Tax=Vespula vulgaris TaxID=7454 RepID=A0A834K695_VESVU|nr:hypothetical protein HZH66_005874 [Vespula vulgaris]
MKLSISPDLPAHFNEHDEASYRLSERGVAVGIIIVKSSFFAYRLYGARSFLRSKAHGNALYPYLGINGTQSSCDLN